MDYKKVIRRLDGCVEFDGNLLDDAADAIETLLAERDDALRAQQTPLDRSRWEGCETCGTKHCWACKNVLCLEEENPCSACNMGSEFEPIGFCPDCGLPLTEEAWAELERRINGGTTN